MDARSGYLLEKLPKSEVEDVTLEEVPDISYEDIGGLGKPSRPSRTRMKLPYSLRRLSSREHHLAPAQGRVAPSAET